MMSSLLKHAELEMKHAWPENEEMQDMIKDNIKELLTVFSEQDHSGSSASYVLSAFGKLANHEALTPLTGENWEWVEVADGMYQNKRDSRVFKGNDNKAYFIDGKIFEDANGNYYTSSESAVYIDFPYTPKSEYVKYKDQTEGSTNEL